MGLRGAEGVLDLPEGSMAMVKSQTKNLDYRGFDSSRSLILRVGMSRFHRELPCNLDSEIIRLRILSSRIDHGGS